MDREIRFRVFDKSIPKHIGLDELDNPSGDMVPWEYVCNSKYLQGGFDGLYPIMQFTGLLDKNNNPIYEGDIVRAANNQIQEICYGEWEYEYDGNNEVCSICGIGFHWADGEPLSVCNSNKSYEIIGNIYENPELLTTK